MAITSITPIINTQTKTIKPQSLEKTTSTASEQNNEKLTNVLVGLASLAIATAGIAYGIKKGKTGSMEVIEKMQKTSEEFQNIAKEAAEKIGKEVAKAEIAAEKSESFASKSETTTKEVIKKVEEEVVKAKGVAAKAESSANYSERAYRAAENSATNANSAESKARVYTKETKDAAIRAEDAAIKAEDIAKKRKTIIKRDKNGNIEYLKITTHKGLIQETNIHRYGNGEVKFSWVKTTFKNTTSEVTKDSDGRLLRSESRTKKGNKEIIVRKDSNGKIENTEIITKKGNKKIVVKKDSNGEVKDTKIITKNGDRETIVLKMSDGTSKITITEPCKVPREYSKGDGTSYTKMEEYSKITEIFKDTKGTVTKSEVTVKTSSFPFLGDVFSSSETIFEGNKKTVTLHEGPGFVSLSRKEETEVFKDEKGNIIGSKVIIKDYKTNNTTTKTITKDKYGNEIIETIIQDKNGNAIKN